MNEAKQEYLEAQIALLSPLEFSIPAELSSLSLTLLKTHDQCPEVMHPQALNSSNEWAVKIRE
jgi:hypothetical protein